MQVMSFAERALGAAGIGGWEVDVATGAVVWTEITYRIHEVEPGYRPTLKAAMGFYAAWARPMLRAAIDRALECGTPWDLELRFITAAGRKIWVRSCGVPLRDGSRTTAITGTCEDVTSRHRAHKLALRLSMVVQQITNAALLVNRAGCIEWINEAFTRLTGYTLDDSRGRRPGDLLGGPQTDPATARHMGACLEQGVGFDVEVIHHNRDGKPYWIGVVCTALQNASGAIVGFIAMQSDITARKAYEAALRHESEERRRAEELLRDVLEAIPSAVGAYDHNERLLLSNHAYRELFPLCAADSTPGPTLEEVIRHAVEGGRIAEAGTEPAAQEEWLAKHLLACRVQGGARTIALAGNAFVQAHETRTTSGILVCVRNDMTTIKRAEAEVRALADRDVLTGLVNRRGFLAALTAALSPHARQEPSPMGGVLMLFDVDHFKLVNDTFGHDVGDALLAEIAARLQSCTRGADLPARLGGDEFVFILPGVISPRAAVARIDTIMAAIARPMRLNGRTLHVTVSAGVSLYPRDSHDAAGLLKTADVALYKAKDAGRARWCFFREPQGALLPPG